MNTAQRVKIAMLLASLMAAPVFAELPQPSNGAEAAYIAYVAAWKNKDMVELNAVIADDYMTLNGQRKVAHKADELAEAKADSTYDKMQVEEIHSVIVGDTAVVSRRHQRRGRRPNR